MSMSMSMPAPETCSSPRPEATPLSRRSLVSSTPEIARLRAMGVDPEAEEKRLLALRDKFVSLVREAPEPLHALTFAEGLLPISSTEAQALASDAEHELSFRGDLARTVRLGTVLRASMQWELQAYRVRAKSQHLWKRHYLTLLYLENRSRAVGPQLDALAQAAARRGLREKAEHISAINAVLRQHAEEISGLHPHEADEGGALQVDPQWEEDRLLDMLHYLAARAKESTQPLPSIELGKGVLPLTEVQWQSLVVDCSPEEQSFRSEFHAVMRRSLALLALMQEELASPLNRPGPSRRKGLGSSYYSDNVAALRPRLHLLIAEARRRSLTAKAEEISRTDAQLVSSLQGITSRQA